MKQATRKLVDHFDQTIFDAIHSRSLVYNTCWEDPAVDRQALQLTSRVITSAGCNTLGYALQGPAHVHAVDANPRQTALLELKLAGIRGLDFADFFQLFGHSRHAAFEESYRDVIARFPASAGDGEVELGEGTGRNLEFFGERLSALAWVELVDLCPPLLAVARERWAARRHVRLVEADAGDYRPSSPPDCVYFSYALTMIPDWRRAIDNPVAMLRPGGALGVVDFHLPDTRWPSRLWRAWFGHDGVWLSADHLPHLRARLDPIACEERRGTLPYLAGLRVPYYLFVGGKR